MDTERRMTTQEMLAQHKKLMDEAQRLEPSVMVTERNWSALLEMQDRLFRQQMQLNADLKTLLTKQEAQNALTEMQESAEKFERQAGNLNEKYSSGCKALTETTKNALTTILNDTENQLSDTVQEARKKIHLCAWISIAALILCATLCALAVLKQVGSSERYLYVVKDGKAERRSVKVGRQIGSDVDILSGVADGEQIAVTALSRLADGVEVEVKE